MKVIKKNILFFGTPDFAVESLKLIYKSNHHLLAVVTIPDKPKGRNRKVQFSPIKQFSIKYNIKLLQPENLKSEDFLNEIKKLDPDLGVVVAFRILPKTIWEYPRYGTINLHASYLPNYRGAAPINWALINGEAYTGVTIFRLKSSVDKGDILIQKKINIESKETAKSLHDKLMYSGAKLLIEAINIIFKGKAIYISQNNDKEIRIAPKIYKKDCKINFNLSAINIINFIHGLSPYPGSYMILKDLKEITKICKLIDVDYISDNLPNSNFLEIKETDTDIYILLNVGKIKINFLQMEGKKKMKTEVFLKGNSLKGFKIIQ